MGGTAAILGGLAIIWRARRKLLWGLCAVLFPGGALWQVPAFRSFASAAASTLS